MFFFLSVSYWCKAAQLLGIEEAVEYINNLFYFHL